MVLNPSRRLRLHCNMQIMRRLLLCWHRLQCRVVSSFFLFFITIIWLILFSDNQPTNERPSPQICKETSGDSTPKKNHQPPTWYGSCQQQKNVFKLSSKSFSFFHCFALICYLWQATVQDVLKRANLPLVDWWHQSLEDVSKVAEVVS